MKLSLISNDLELQKELELSGYFQEIENISNIQEAEKSDVIIISDLLFSYNELTQIETSNMKAKIYYMVSNYDKKILDSINLICKTNNIKVIPPKLTINQIKSRIIKDLFPHADSNKNVITFFGADKKVGTTMITQSCAEILAKNTNRKVIVLMLSGDVGTYYIKVKDDYAGLEQLKIKLENKILKSNELIYNCIKKDDLYILPGINNFLKARQFHPEYIDYLIELAAKEFDLVLIDAGCNIDSGMAIASLNATDKKYLVTTQQNIPKLKFEKTEQVLRQLHINPEDFLLIVNNYLADDAIYTASQIADMYRTSLCSYVPSLGFVGWQAEYDNKTLIHYNNKDYNDKINLISKTIATQLGIDFIQEEEEKTLVKKILNMLGGAS